MKIEHIALYVKDLETARSFFVKYLGAKSNEGYHNLKTGFRSYFLSFGDGGRRWRCFQMVSHARMRNISISIQRHLEQKYPIRSIF